MKHNEYTRKDLQADLDILGYFFADMVMSKLENRPPSEELIARHHEIFPRVMEVLDDDECLSHTIDFDKRTRKIVESRVTIEKKQMGEA